MCVWNDSTVPVESDSLPTTFSATHSQDETNAKSNQKGSIKKSRRGKLCDISLSDSHCVTLFTNSSHTFQVMATSGFIISCRGITKTHTHTFYDLMLSLKSMRKVVKCRLAISPPLPLWIVNVNFLIAPFLFLLNSYRHTQLKPRWARDKFWELSRRRPISSIWLINLHLTFLFVPRILSFIGLALCLSIMLMTSVLFAAIAMGMAIVMYKYIEYCG